MKTLSKRGILVACFCFFQLEPRPSEGPVHLGPGILSDSWILDILGYLEVVIGSYDEGTLIHECL